MIPATYKAHGGKNAVNRMLCSLLLVLRLSLVAAEPVPAPLEPSHRFVMGVYYPSISNLSTRTDFQVAINLWLEEFAQPLGLHPSQARLFDDIQAMKQAFDDNELDFIMAPPVLLAKHIDRGKLADGFVGTSVDDSEYGTVLLARKDQHIKNLGQLAGKKLMLPEHDDLAEIFLDTLTIKTFKRHYRQVFSGVNRKERQSAVVLSLFFHRADVGMAYTEIYHLMVEMNPQIEEKLEILATFPTKSPNYGYFHRQYPQELRHDIAETIRELNNQPRSQQILNELRMKSLIPCAVDELAPFDNLLMEYQTLQQGINK